MAYLIKKSSLFPTTLPSKTPLKWGMFYDNIAEYESKNSRCRT